MNFPEYRSSDSIVLTFNLTWFCPVHCEYCYRATSVNQRKKAVLPEEILIRECKIAATCGIREFRFSGGEPITLGDKLFAYADIVNSVTGHKPVLMTSGFGIDDRWMDKAKGKFSAIAISVENPFAPLQSVVNNERILDIMRTNFCEELPFSYGLTLVTAEHFKNIVRIFDFLYKNVDYRFMPQLDYPCLNSFVQPSSAQLQDIRTATKELFERYGPIPFYFVYLIGSLVWLEQGITRIVLNLHPEGNYQIYDSLQERCQVEYRWQHYVEKQRRDSGICQKCEWLESCAHHPLWDVRYEWCELRKTIFQGIYEGLHIT